MKMSDVFNLPLSTEKVYKRLGHAWGIDENKVEAITTAINNHDRLEQENVKMKEQRDTWSKLFHSENKENNRLLQENAELREALNVLVYKDSWGNYFTGLHGDSDVTEIVKQLLNK